MGIHVRQTMVTSRNRAHPPAQDEPFLLAQEVDPRLVQVYHDLLM